MIVKEMILSSFKEYMELDRAVTIMGFKRFLVKDKFFDYKLINEFDRFLIENRDILEFMKICSEGDLVDKGLEGKLSANMCKFILESKFKYTVTNVVESINYEKPYLPLKDEGN